MSDENAPRIEMAEVDIEVRVSARGATKTLNWGVSLNLASATTLLERRLDDNARLEWRLKEIENAIRDSVDVRVAQCLLQGAHPASVVRWTESESTKNDEVDS